MRFLATLFLAWSALAAAPYDLARMPPIGWVRGSTVGIVGYPDGPPGRATNGATIINAGLAPYNADPTGATDTIAAFNAAKAAATSNTFILFPDGIYKFNSTPTLDKTGVTVGGTNYGGVTWYNTNGAFSQLLRFGGPEPPSGEVIGIFSGATRGSTNITVASNTAAIVGDIILVQQVNTTNALRQIISTTGFQNLEKWTCRITAKTGTNLTIWPPLPVAFTNAPSIVLWSRSFSGFVPIQMSGIENINFTMTHNGVSGTGGFVVRRGYTINCWIKNCQILEPYNYNLESANNVNAYTGGVTLKQKIGGPAVSNHGGLLNSYESGHLVENSALMQRLFPGHEFNSGWSGNAMFACLFTNNWSDILCHNAHPMFNLFEGINANIVLADGYFGSSSDNTFFRCSFSVSGFPTILFKRFNTFFQVIGCVLGTNATYTGYDYGTNIGNFPYIKQTGFPNIGNNGYDYLSPPVFWNWPGRVWQLGGSPNGYTFPGPQSGTTLSGDFSFFTSTLFPAWIQKAANTNFYVSGDDGNLAMPTAVGTGSSLTLNRVVSVVTGDTLYIVGAPGFQTFQSNNVATHIFNGSFDFFNLAQTFAAGYSTVIPSGILYSNTAPSWWFRTNSFNSSLVVDSYPAQLPEASGTNFAQKVKLIPPQIWISDGSDPFTGAASFVPPVIVTNPPPIIIGGDVILRGGVNAQIHL